MPAIVWAGVILVVTSWPNPQLPFSASGLDKVAHFSMYGILGFLVGRALPRHRLLSALVAAALGLAMFGALDEWHQRFVPGRSADIRDWLADVAGMVLGLLLAHFLLLRAPLRRDASS
ncbi:MAG: VanZ family protein [Gemmatimonadota bacterium]|nr:VanZ family protein [Gemmatimonadota bacterium]